MTHGQRNIQLSKSSVVVACFFPGRAKDLSAPLYFCIFSAPCYAVVCSLSACTIFPTLFHKRKYYREKII